MDEKKIVERIIKSAVKMPMEKYNAYIDTLDDVIEKELKRGYDGIDYDGEEFSFWSRDLPSKISVDGYSIIDEKINKARVSANIEEKGHNIDTFRKEVRLTWNPKKDGKKIADAIIDVVENVLRAIDFLYNQF